MTPENIQEFLTWMAKHSGSVRLVQLLGWGTRCAIHRPQTVFYTTKGVQFVASAARTAPNISVTFQDAIKAVCHEATPSSPAGGETVIEGPQTLYINL